MNKSMTDEEVNHKAELEENEYALDLATVRVSTLENLIRAVLAESAGNQVPNAISPAQQAVRTLRQHAIMHGIVPDPVQALRAAERALDEARLAADAAQREYERARRVVDAEGLTP
jgi:hypothetical protein